MYLKRMLRTCRIQIQDEKVCFFEKETFFRIFLIFFPKGGPFGIRMKKKNLFKFFEISKNFLEK